MDAAPLDSLLPGSLVSAPWLAAHLGPPVIVLDATVALPAARYDGDYRPASARDGFAAGHLPGARYAELLGDLSDHQAPYHFARPPASQLAAALGRLGVTSSSVVVAYDTAGGVWAARLWWLLRWIGVPAAVLDGGWQAWVAEGGAVEAGLPEPAPHEMPGLVPAPAAARERDGMWASKAEVAGVALGSQPGTLVCALSAELYTGSAPTRYSRRGHIPASVNVPARDLTDAAGRIRPAGDLDEALAVIGEDAPVIVYCGGGISAAVVAQALTIRGRTDVAIYDGSLEEWSADPHLPVETGP